MIDRLHPNRSAKPAQAFSRGPTERPLVVGVSPDGFEALSAEERRVTEMVLDLQGHVSLLRFTAPRLQEHPQAMADVLITPADLGDVWARVGQPNARSPQEAARIVGLFLRSRGDFTSPIGHVASRWLFYWALARLQIPSFWPLFSRLVALDKDQRGVLDLGGSVLTRAARGLEARDQIGEHFYAAAGHDSAERMAYHFDYLALLLQGLFDAFGRLASSVLALPVEPHMVNLRRGSRQGKTFLRELESAAPLLAKLIRDPEAQSYLDLVALLRNTIHGAQMQLMSASGSDRQAPSGAYLLVSTYHSPTLLRALSGLGSQEDWGVAKQHVFYVLEPFTAASALVDRGLALVDRLGWALDTMMTEVPASLSGPPDRDIFSERVAARLRVFA